MKLDDIKKAVEKAYVALPIEFTEEDSVEAPKLTLNLRNMLRLSEAEQKQVEALGQAINEDDSIAAVRPKFRTYLEILSGDAQLVARFMNVIDNDLAIILYVIEEYQKVTQAEKA